MKNLRNISLMMLLITSSGSLIEAMARAAAPKPSAKPAGNQVKGAGRAGRVAKAQAGPSKAQRAQTHNQNRLANVISAKAKRATANQSQFQSQVAVGRQAHGLQMKSLTSQIQAQGKPKYRETKPANAKSIAISKLDSQVAGNRAKSLKSGYISEGQVALKSPVAKFASRVGSALNVPNQGIFVPKQTVGYANKTSIPTSNALTLYNPKTAKANRTMSQYLAQRPGKMANAAGRMSSNAYQSAGRIARNAPQAAKNMVSATGEALGFTSRGILKNTVRNRNINKEFNRLKQESVQSNITNHPDMNANMSPASRQVLQRKQASKDASLKLEAEGNVIRQELQTATAAPSRTYSQYLAQRPGKMANAAKRYISKTGEFLKIPSQGILKPKVSTAPVTTAPTSTALVVPKTGFEYVPRPIGINPARYSAPLSRIDAAWAKVTGKKNAKQQEASSNNISTGYEIVPRPGATGRPNAPSGLNQNNIARNTFSTKSPSATGSIPVQIATYRSAGLNVGPNGSALAVA